MQWSFTRPLSPTPGALKRPLSSPSLAAMAKQQRSAPAAQQPGGGGTAPMAVDGAAVTAGVPGRQVDVAAVAAKHGWDLTQHNTDWSGDRQVKWLRVDEIRRPLQGARSNGALR